MSSRVGIVPTGKVSVVRSNDWEELSAKSVNALQQLLTRVGLALLDVLPIPLSNTRSTSIRQDNAADTLKRLDEPVSGDCRSDLLGSRSNGECRFGLETV